jgi:hypothetical protein
MRGINQIGPPRRAWGYSSPITGRFGPLFMVASKTWCTPSATPIKTCQNCTYVAHTTSQGTNHIPYAALTTTNSALSNNFAGLPGSNVRIVHAHEVGGCERGTTQGALRLLLAPLGDARPAEHVAAGRRRRVRAPREAQRAGAAQVSWLGAAALFHGATKHDDSFLVAARLQLNAMCQSSPGPTPHKSRAGPNTGTNHVASGPPAAMMQPTGNA